MNMDVSAEEAAKDINVTLLKYGLEVYDWEDKGLHSKFYIHYFDGNEELYDLRADTQDTY